MTTLEAKTNDLDSKIDDLKMDLLVLYMNDEVKKKLEDTSGGPSLVTTFMLREGQKTSRAFSRWWKTPLSSGFSFLRHVWGGLSRSLPLLDLAKGNAVLNAKLWTRPLKILRVNLAGKSTYYPPPLPGGVDFSSEDTNVQAQLDHFQGLREAIAERIERCKATHVGVFNHEEKVTMRGFAWGQRWPWRVVTLSNLATSIYPVDMNGDAGTLRAIREWGSGISREEGKMNEYDRVTNKTRKRLEWKNELVKTGEKLFEESEGRGSFANLHPSSSHWRDK